MRRSGSNLWCNCNEQRSPGSSVTLSSLSLIDRAASLFSRHPFILKAGACFFCAICFQAGCLARDTVTLALTVHEMLLHFLLRDHLRTSADIMSVLSVVEIYGIHLNPLTLVLFSPLCCLCSSPWSVFEHLGWKMGLTQTINSVCEAFLWSTTFAHFFQTNTKTWCISV